MTNLTPELSQEGLKYNLRYDPLTGDLTSELTQEILKYHLNYDPLTGVFTWLRPLAYIVKPGDIAGNVNLRGYRRISVLNKPYLEHRLAFLYMTGHWPAHNIDHINGVFADNRWCNLREATQQQNLRNRKCRGQSGIKNVYKEHNVWQVRFTINKVIVSYGSYKTIEEAEQRALQVRARLHGDFCNNK